MRGSFEFLLEAITNKKLSLNIISFTDKILKVRSDIMKILIKN